MYSPVRFPAIKISVGAQQKQPKKRSFAAAGQIANHGLDLLFLRYSRLSPLIGIWGNCSIFKSICDLLYSSVRSFACHPPPRSCLSESHANTANKWQGSTVSDALLYNDKGRQLKGRDATYRRRMTIKALSSWRQEWKASGGRQQVVVVSLIIGTRNTFSLSVHVVLLVFGNIIRRHHHQAYY